MFKFIMNLFSHVNDGDMSKHRVHTAKYEDLCM